MNELWMDDEKPIIIVPFLRHTALTTVVSEEPTVNDRGFWSSCRCTVLGLVKYDTYLMFNPLFMRMCAVRGVVSYSKLSLVNNCHSYFGVFDNN